MADAIRLRVLTESGLALEDDAVSMVAPGGVGYIGFLRNHAPLVTTLQPGKLAWQTPSGQRKAVRIGEGLLEIAKNRVTILTSTVVTSERSPATQEASR